MNQKKKEFRGGKGSLLERYRGWRLSFSIDGESIVKGLVCGGLLVFFSLTQTTIFAKFRPYGAIPDLILPLVTAVAMTEKEKWGAVFGLISAFVIESLGGSTFTILPILYMLTGYLVGILTTFYFRDSFATRALYTLVTAAVRVIFTLIAIFATIGGVTFISAIRAAVIPEFLATVTFAFIPHIAAKICLKPFNKSREERTK